MTDNYRNPCLTLHQPWASLLIHGIKRIEGRSWPAPVRGRLWIHAAAKIPDLETIQAMEEFYKEVYKIDGVTDIKFPEHYPVSQLLGCVNVVGCVKCEELVCWEELSNGVRMEGQTDFCWLCEDPQKLLVPFEMRGYQGVYNLERKIFASAVRGLRPVESPLPVKFPLPDLSNPFSLKPGALTHISSSSDNLVKTPGMDAAIAGARAAATQFKKKGQGARADSSRLKFDREKGVEFGSSKSRGGFLESSQTKPKAVSSIVNQSSRLNARTPGAGPFSKPMMHEENSRLESYHADRAESHHPETRASSSRIFAAAVRDLKPS
uniref:ASCH domain-containing protein n=1 Tax=Araucaria cunninghamii TaxID=56994 RepID=A0A0D6R641_ARACU